MDQGWAMLPRGQVPFRPKYFFSLFFGEGGESMLLPAFRYSLRLAVSSLARHHAFDEVDEAPQALQATRLLRPSLASAELDEIDEEDTGWLQISLIAGDQ